MAGPYIADRRLYLDKDGNLVEANDPRKASLLVGKGGMLSQEQALRYGLIKPPAPAPEVKAKIELPANKAKKTAPENKAKV